MDAFIRNRAEHKLLLAIRRIADLLGQKVEIKTLAYQQGGLIETFLFCLGSAGSVGFLFKSSLNDIITYYATGGWKRDKLENQIYEVDIEKKRADVAKIKADVGKTQAEKRKLEAEAIAQELQNRQHLANPDVILHDEEAIRRISDFYKIVKDDKEITKIGFRQGEARQETMVDHSEFEHLIFRGVKDIRIVENAELVIDAPVLRSRRHWRAFYRHQPIDFKMKDGRFLANVARGVYSFDSATRLIVTLEISTTFNDEGKAIKKDYAVLNVSGIKKAGAPLTEVADLSKRQRELF